MAYAFFLLKETRDLVTDVASVRLKTLLDEAISEAGLALRQPR